MTRARIESSPLVAGGVVFVTGADNKLYALDAAGGAKKWEHDVGAAMNASPAVADGKLVVATVDGRVLCFSAQ